MNDELINHIEDMGLSNKEARVYVASLMLGPSPVQRIADQSGIKRVTTYVILESLVSLGLVSQSTKGKKTYFNAEEPSNLRRLLDKREAELKEQKASLEQVLPELGNLKSLPKEAPSVKYYEGAEGIKSIFQNFFSGQGSRDLIFGISNLDQLYTFFPEFREHGGNPQRTSQNIPSRIIYTTKQGAILKDQDTAKNRQSRWVPADQFPFSGDFNVNGDYIILLALQGSMPLGITIQSQELAKGFEAIFDLAWRAAEPFNKI